MKKEKQNSTKLVSLRQKAEEQLEKQHSVKDSPLITTRSHSKPPSANQHYFDPFEISEGNFESDNLKLIHELQVHQIELEMQNEELRIAEERAKINAEKYTELYDFAPAGYFTLSYDGTIYGLNLNGAGLLCKERAHLVKSNFRFFVAPETLLDFDDFLQKIFASNASESCEVRLIADGNPSVYVHLEGIALEVEQKCLVTAIDISRRKLAEKALEKSEANLRALNAAKDKFFSIIAHDLKNPFITIIGFSDMLAEQVREKNYEGIQEYAEIIQNSSQRAMDLLMNLMEWSRSQTGRMEFAPEQIEIFALIDEVTELLNYTARQKSINIYTEGRHKTVVFADRAMIGTVLRNLISNAIKFTNPGDEVVILAEQNENELVVSVADNGVGIKKEAIDKLFRIDVNYVTMGTQNEKGTGLGLILCKEFISKHGGKIWAESDPEKKGSRFCFTIPKSTKIT